MAQQNIRVPKLREKKTGKYFRMLRKQTPEGRVWVCCDKSCCNAFGHNGRCKHGQVKQYWTGEAKLRKWPKG